MIEVTETATGHLYCYEEYDSFDLVSDPMTISGTAHGHTGSGVPVATPYTYSFPKADYTAVEVS